MLFYSKCYSILSGYWADIYTWPIYTSLLHLLNLEIVTEDLEVLLNEVADILLKKKKKNPTFWWEQSKGAWKGGWHTIS